MSKNNGEKRLTVGEIPLKLDAKWRQDDKFVCNRCGKPAFLHPDTNYIWRCKQCEFVTYSPSLFFEPI